MTTEDDVRQDTITAGGQHDPGHSQRDDLNSEQSLREALEAIKAEASGLSTESVLRLNGRLLRIVVACNAALEAE